MRSGTFTVLRDGIRGHGTSSVRATRNPDEHQRGCRACAVLLVLAVDRVGGIGEMPGSKTDLEDAGARVSFLIKRFVGAAVFGAAAREWLT